MTSSRPILPCTPDGSIDGNANPNSHDDNDDDAQSDISVPYSSLTESTTTTSGNGFLTPTSSDAHTVAAEGVNLQTISSVLHEMDSSDHHDGRIDDSLAQWRSLYHDEIERQIIENRNRDRERRNTITNTLSARNLQLHTSQTSETLAGSGGGEGGARLHENAQTRRREKGERSESSPSDSSSTSSGSSSYMNAPAYESAPTSPSYAAAQESKPGPPPSSSRYTRHADPQPNQSFILLEASTGRALTLIDGNLTLVHVPDPDLISLTDQKGSDPYLFPNSGAEQPCIVKGQCNWHWHCVENAGWLGFRNAASGTFLGHDMWQNIIARVYRHQGWEFMTVRPALERKGWYLMVTHWEKLHKINFLEERRAFVATNPEEGTVWEFVRV
ncbi:hypothetical protein NCU06081 [Neurospora crassa OR74A]|uniref:Uncharacterized protein n=1 Tax=Neurospora crassa (strain ATCC 24698 / 74-OR23-1A / CBS 708.71 / DSM 1257 / FGSC 987) TaxID=367110 RepID=V5IKJ0_NEUCR|nr:hypothetical protein NCU06081 [Neurospora crassa OR74A]ESA41912.1 hypothetical protein NCU06081 [Neurospora crassa OR74A]|eukprot:XP_011395236.1 hypothetical protein NCU06081 [Neurospora crassa OR74A]